MKFVKTYEMYEDLKGKIDVKNNRVESAIVDVPFHIGKRILENLGYSIISLEENARLRVQQGKNAEVSKSGNWVREDFLYVPKKERYITKNPQIMLNAEKATIASFYGKPFYLTPEQVEESLKKAVKLPKSYYHIPTNRFKEDEVTNFIFEEISEEYGYWLNNELNEDAITIFGSTLKSFDIPHTTKMSISAGGSLLDKGLQLYADNTLRGIKTLESKVVP